MPQIRTDLRKATTANTALALRVKILEATAFHKTSSLQFQELPLGRWSLNLLTIKNILVNRCSGVGAMGIRLMGITKIINQAFSNRSIKAHPSKVMIGVLIIQECPTVTAHPMIGRKCRCKPVLTPLNHYQITMSTATGHRQANIYHTWIIE